MRVQVRWADEPVGAITDIACFEPVAGQIERDRSRADEAATEQPRSSEVPGTVTKVITPVALDYQYAASPEESAFFRGLPRAGSLGQRCPKCQKVYVPPRSACPVDGVPTTDEVELPDTGTLTTFCIVNVPFLGQQITPPYVSAYVLLDGADIAFLHLILEIPAERGPDGDAGRRRSGSRARSGAPRSRTSTTSRPPASRTRTTTPTRSTSEQEHGTTMRDVAVVGLRPATDGGVRRVAHVRGAAGPALRGVLRADRLDQARHRLLVLRAPRTTWPAGRSRSCPRSTRSG